MPLPGGRHAVPRKGCLTRPPLPQFLFLLLFLLALGTAAAPRWAWAAAAPLTGRQIIEESVRRHDFYPYTFERQSMVLTDRAGNRDVRTLRRYSRFEQDGTLKFLLVLDYPPDVRGVALLATRHPDGTIDNGVYLPAFGKQLLSAGGADGHTAFLGTDFTLQDLIPEVPDDFTYHREADRTIDDIAHFVVTARPRDAKAARETGYALRRLFIRQDNFFIVRIDYFDRLGRPLRRCTRHDLRRVNGPMWRADMTLMENLRDRHTTLIKVTRRVFSRDYVPEQLFTPKWVLGEHHLRDGEFALFERPEEKTNDKGDK